MKIKSLLMTSMIILLFTSCGDDDKPNPPTPEEKGNILVETTVYNPDGASGSSYIQLISSLSGNVNNSNAKQIDFGSPIYVYGNDFYTFPSFGKDATNEIVRYTYQNGEIVKSNTLPTPPFSFASNIVKVSDTKAYVAMYSLGTVWVINPKTMEKTGEIDLTSYAHNDNTPEPSLGIVRDGKYFLPLNQLDQNWMPYGDHVQVDVAVIDISTNQVEKIISEENSQLSFPVRPMLENMIFTNEKNDIYMACSGYFGFNPAMPQSGFVCIPSGQTDFDSSKSWDISNTTIEGTNYKPVSLLNTQYIGDGKVAAYVAIAELAGSNPYTSKYSMAVIMDMKNKTIKQINGIPISSGHGVFIDKQNDLIVFGVDGNDKVGFFTYNPSTEEVKQIINTVGAPAFLHIFE